MNIEAIKSGTAEHYRTEGKEEFLKERISFFKDDIIKDFKNSGIENFESFKEKSLEEMNGFAPYGDLLLSLGIFILALDSVEPADL